jgi:hypothetical protein
MCRKAQCSHILSQALNLPTGATQHEEAEASVPFTPSGRLSTPWKVQGPPGKHPNHYLLQVPYLRLAPSHPPLPTALSGLQAPAAGSLLVLCPLEAEQIASSLRTTWLQTGSFSRAH